MSKTLTIIDYGAGNVFSVVSAFRRLGVEPVLSANPDTICSSDYVVFPGVGHAKHAMNNLRERNLEVIIPELKQPVIGICLGMQLMCNTTEEGNSTGLGIFEDVDIKRFATDLPVPHIGWNLIENTRSILNGLEGDVYFVHGYFANLSQHTIAISNYVQAFSAALQKGNFFGCQFHPEKSGELGTKILERFLSGQKGKY